MDNWKDIPSYEGIYKISDTGKVRSVERYVKHRKNQILIKGRIRKLKSHRSGYLCIDLHKGESVDKWFQVHRLVGIAFIPNPDNKPEINHIDGNKSNNHYTNLEWCTRSENMKHAYDIGLIINPSRKSVTITKDDMILKFTNCYEADKHIGCSGGNVSRVARGERTSIHGWKCEFN